MSVARTPDLAPRLAPIPRITLTPDEAAHALGCSRDFFDEHIAPELRVIRKGRRRLYAVRELEHWAEREAALALEGGR